jgi:hypothetical protein
MEAISNTKQCALKFSKINSKTVQTYCTRFMSIFFRPVRIILFGHALIIIFLHSASLFIKPSFSPANGLVVGMIAYYCWLLIVLPISVVALLWLIYKVIKTLHAKSIPLPKSPTGRHFFQKMFVLFDSLSFCYCAATIGYLYWVFY